ncbi:MAG TPA: hypothetical protein VLT33_21935 [Labilithrix sp.]|nr:hypothetical protein [Labilithrix sp.]
MATLASAKAMRAARDVVDSRDLVLLALPACLACPQNGHAASWLRT